MDDKLKAEATAAWLAWRDVHGSEICELKNQIMIWIAAVDWMESENAALREVVDEFAKYTHDTMTGVRPTVTADMAKYTTCPFPPEDRAKKDAGL